MKLIDKSALVAEIKRLLAFYLKEIEDNKEDPWGMDIAKRDILQEILSFTDTLEVKEAQEEPISIWHDSSKETPIQGSNILMIRKEESPDFPPIAGCFHSTNSRLDGRNWGYYNGFCYNEIEPPLKWAYVDDLLNLSNVYIRPIPLTPEILEKNGFKYKEGETGMYGVTTAPHYICDGVPFEVFCDGEPFAIWFKEPVNIKFVHQLQHALRLCGIKKEIEL